MWFVSGIAMIYARGMPSLTPESRLQHLPKLDPSAVLLNPVQALQRTRFSGSPRSATLLTVLNRPAYRFIGRGAATVFADSGELLEMTPARAVESASLFMNLTADKIHDAGFLTEPDQWTVGDRRSLPLYKFTVDDELGTVLYVSERTGEVAVLTTQGSRSLAWIAAIPHWLYFEALRSRPELWRQVVLWASGLATIASLIGLILSVIQYRRRRPHIPYAGWLRWHYITGVVFGIFTVTWVFSGFLSMEPWFWASDGGLGAGMEESLQGGSLDLTKFEVAVPMVEGAKEIQFRTILGEPYYQIQAEDPKPVMVSAVSQQVRQEPFETSSLVSRVLAPTPDVKVLETTLLDTYDSYYYSFNGRAPLPVLRLKFDDPDSTWIYLDPQTSSLVGRAHFRERIQRWIYHGLHSLDFSFWYYNRPLWDTGVIVLSLGGTALSLIGVVIAWKRVTRAIVRSRS